MKEPNTPILLTENLEEEIINDNILHNHKKKTLFLRLLYMLWTLFAMLDKYLNSHTPVLFRRQ